jgi:hypothetical protein
MARVTRCLGRWSRSRRARPRRSAGRTTPVGISRFGAHRPRVEEVQILNGSRVLESYKIQTLKPGTIGATGWVAHTLGLSSRAAGQAVQLEFRLTIPEPFTGPANFAIDNVALLTG